MGNHDATQLYSQLKEEWHRGDRLDQANVRQLLARLKAGQELFSPPSRCTRTVQVQPPVSAVRIRRPRLRELVSSCSSSLGCQDGDPEVDIELSGLGLLFPSASNLETGPLTTAREVLEIGAFYSVRTNDIPAFERYLSLLSTPQLPPSPHQAPLVALSLLRLLSQNRIAEFHTVLETLKAEVVESSEVAWVLQLERSLMEGAYSRVWALCRSSPAGTSTSTALPLPEFAHFTPTLIATVRNEIAACDERAYESLPVRDAKTLLFFEREDEVVAFAKEVSCEWRIVPFPSDAGRRRTFERPAGSPGRSRAARLRTHGHLRSPPGQQRTWYLDPSTSLLHFPSSPLHPSRRGLPATMATGFEGEDRELDRSKVVTATLGYARELESIV
ncbi:SPOSA6832_05145 [Sporobolomyces salmonicolor]|uniref:SPOSA6832_05145-mRNA-1:cds n=1 Tax=Sporidiobolus salmonicolor TaxID=5005 RepID=A0A0D6ETF9_SPOSA|nr:SPOSA6832_05145 [Sporobolomyces salmonicolor]